MNKNFFIAACLIIVLTVSSFSQNKKMGAGVILGEPIGVSLKYWLTESSALDAGFAWSFVDENAFQIQADYLIHNFSLIKVSEGKLPFYFGIGGRLKFSHDIILGVRVPVGLAYIFAYQPIDVFVEIAPILDLLPQTDFTISAAVGGRYYFNL